MENSEIKGAFFPKESETIEVYLSETQHPEAFRRKVSELIKSGLTEDEAKKFVRTTPFILELCYSADAGLFAVESEALDSLQNEMVDPYTGNNVIVEEYEY